MNERITKQVLSALEHDRRVDLHRDRVEVGFDDGVATLSGEVSSIAAKRVTLELTARLPEVTGVVDRLRVRPAEAMGDGAIADHLERALAADTVFAEYALYRQVGAGARRVVRAGGGEGAAGGCWIEIRVEDGVVTLDGDVPSLSHKRLAGALAWWVPGSRDVINGLGVEPPEEDNDQEILDALRIVLEKDPMLDATQIRPRCKNSIVTLEGWAVSDAQRDLVEFDAWALFGVDGVVNDIEVRRA